MNIEIHDAALEARIKKQLQATGSASVEEVLLRLLETQEEQDRWLAENRETINAKIQRGIDQLDRGQGIPEDQLDAYLADLKAKPERRGATFLRRKPRSTWSKSGATSRNKAALKSRTALSRSFGTRSFSWRQTPVPDTGAEI